MLRIHEGLVNNNTTQKNHNVSRSNTSAPSSRKLNQMLVINMHQYQQN